MGQQIGTWDWKTEYAAISEQRRLGGEETRRKPTEEEDKQYWIKVAEKKLTLAMPKVLSLQEAQDQAQDETQDEDEGINEGLALSRATATASEYLQNKSSRKRTSLIEAWMDAGTEAMDLENLCPGRSQLVISQIDDKLEKQSIQDFIDYWDTRGWGMGEDIGEVESKEDD